MLPDGSEARDDDDEFPHLDSRDNVVLGYAVHRFKDSYAAWILQQRAWLPADWANPVLQFLWKDPAVTPRDPATTTESELPRHRLFRGIGHLVLRDGWGEGSTWIQMACGPYFAKHDHLDAAHLVVYHKGYLAIDAGADYTDTESPHYLNHYRRTVAHNTVLVYQPAERFFWSENRWPAANDGGQRMDSSRFWNSVRAWTTMRRTRDLWDRCQLSPVAAEASYRYAHADATRAYQPSKLESFTRELVQLREPNVLVLDRVHAKDPAYRKAWLLHGERAEGRGPRCGRERRPRRDELSRRVRGDVRGRAGARLACTRSCRASGRWSCVEAQGSSSGRRATSAGGLGLGGRTGLSTRPRAARCPRIRTS